MPAEAQPRTLASAAPLRSDALRRAHHPRVAVRVETDVRGGAGESLELPVRPSVDLASLVDDPRRGVRAGADAHAVATLRLPATPHELVNDAVGADHPHIVGPRGDIASPAVLPNEVAIPPPVDFTGLTDQPWIARAINADRDPDTIGGAPVVPGPLIGPSVSADHPDAAISSDSDIRRLTWQSLKHAVLSAVDLVQRVHHPRRSVRADGDAPSGAIDLLPLGPGPPIDIAVALRALRRGQRRRQRED